MVAPFYFFTYTIDMERFKAERKSDNVINEDLYYIDKTQMLETISYFDYAENYYHGFLIELLSGFDDYEVLSTGRAAWVDQI